jgi:hypothetical protein
MGIKQNFKDIGQGFYSPVPYRRRMMDAKTSFWEMVLCQFIIFAVVLLMALIAGAFYLRFGEMRPVVANFPHLTIVKGIAHADPSPVVLKSKHNIINILVDTDISFDKALKPKYKNYDFVIAKDGFVRTGKKIEVRPFKDVDFADVNTHDIDITAITILILSPFYVAFIAPFVAIGILVAAWRGVLITFAAGLVIALLTQPLQKKRTLLKQGLQAGLLLLYPGFILMLLLDQFVLSHGDWHVTCIVYGIMALLIGMGILAMDKKARK